MRTFKARGAPLGPVSVDEAGRYGTSSEVLFTGAWTWMVLAVIGWVSPFGAVLFLVGLLGNVGLVLWWFSRNARLIGRVGIWRAAPMRGAGRILLEECYRVLGRKGDPVVRSIVVAHGTRLGALAAVLVWVAGWA